MSKSAAIVEPAREIIYERTALANLYLAAEAPPELGLMVRKAPYDPGIYERLKSSIAFAGILMPLIIKRHKGKSYVTAGNCRLTILRELHPDVDDVVFVPTANDANIPGESRELAVMHNIAMPMHPIDQYEVISSAKAGGMSIEDIGARWGFNNRRVLQILAFGDLAPEVRDAWRTNEIDARCAQAFTLGPQDEQRTVLARIRKSGHFDDRSVREAFIGKQRETGPILEFVGVVEYEAAGGRAVRDLFEINHQVNDTKLLRRMADTKLDNACRLLEAGGWAWAMPTPQDDYNYGRKDTARMKSTAEQRAALKAARDAGDWKAEQKIAAEIAYDSFTTEEKAGAGCFVSINPDGTLKIDGGRIKPEDARKVYAGERATERKKKEKTAAKTGTAPPVSNALMQRLSEVLTEAASAALATSPHVAISAIVAGAASLDKACAISEHGLASKKAGSKKLASFESVFANMIKLKPQVLAEHIAALAAKALDFQTFNADSPPLKKKAVAALVEELEPKTFNAALARLFDAADYFGSVNRAALVGAIKEMGLGEDAMKSAGKMPKAEAAEFAAKAAKKAGWLPPPLRTSHYPVPAKPKGKK